MSLNVLIVDDSEVMRKVIKRVFRLAGFEVQTIQEAENGRNALEILDDNWIDIVLTDINMPVMNGEELLQRMKSDEHMRDIPVVIVSTEGRSERINAILEAGAFGFITKPFRPEELRNTICEALGVSPDEQFVEEPQDSDF